MQPAQRMLQSDEGIVVGCWLGRGQSHLCVAGETKAGGRGLGGMHAGHITALPGSWLWLYAPSHTHTHTHGAGTLQSPFTKYSNNKGTCQLPADHVGWTRFGAKIYLCVHTPQPPAWIIPTSCFIQCMQSVLFHKIKLFFSSVVLQTELY